MESILQVAVISVAAALCTVVVRKQAPEIGFVLVILTGVLILQLSYPAMKIILELITTLSETANLEPFVLKPVIKTAGVAITTKIAAEICRDAREGGIASFLETAGAVLALVVCVPLIEAVLSMVGELL